MIHQAYASVADGGPISSTFGSMILAVQNNQLTEEQKLYISELLRDQQLIELQCQEMLND